MTCNKPAVPQRDGFARGRIIDTSIVRVYAAIGLLQSAFLAKAGARKWAIFPDAVEWGPHQEGVTDSSDTGFILARFTSVMGQPVKMHRADTAAPRHELREPILSPET